MGQFWIGCVINDVENCYWKTLVSCGPEGKSVNFPETEIYHLKNTNKIVDVPPSTNLWGPDDSWEGFC